MSATVLLTGATGIVGSEIVRELLRQPDPPELLLLLRGSEEEVAAKKRRIVEWAEVSDERAQRLDVVRGDVTQPSLGLCESDRRRLQQSVTGVIHAAACTRFDQTADSAFLNNVTGTKDVLALARTFTRLTRVGIVSTAFVAGRRGGVIQEQDLDFGFGFNNEYERSKALSEVEVRKAMSDLPIAVYRLSLVVGRRWDGRISRLTGLYPILRLFHEGRLAMISGDGNQAIDLIPLDFAAQSVVRLWKTAFMPGSTYHICAGGERSFKLADLFPAIDAYIAATDPSWAGRGQPLPLMVSPNAFADFVDIVELTGNPRLRQIIQQVRTVTRLLETPRTFDTTELDRNIGNGSALPHAREWLLPIVTRGVETEWRQPWPREW